MSHPVTYTKNIHFGTQNSAVLYSGVYGPDGIWTHDLCGNYFLTQCECVIQTKLDDRSNKVTKRGIFLSLGWLNMSQLPWPFLPILKITIISLQEFDALIDRMRLAFDYADNLGQYVEAAKLLYQMNDQLPDDLQLTFEELDSTDTAKFFIMQHHDELKSAIVNYRQRLMNF